jgi:hypothetical protein
MINAVDKNNWLVKVGSKVRLVKLSTDFLNQLPFEERSEIEQMIGNDFVIHEIDEYGLVWIEQWWDANKKGETMGHSLGLSPNEFELIAE